MRRKFLSVLLAMAMVLTMVPVTALAIEEAAASATLEISVAGDTDGTKTELLTNDKVEIAINAVDSADISNTTILWSTDSTKITDTTLTAGTGIEEYDETDGISYEKLFSEEAEKATVYAVAVKDNAQISVIESSAEYSKATVATPTFDPAAGEVAANTQVEIKCTTPGAGIYYVTDDSTELTASNAKTDGTQYTSKITISEETTIKAIALLENYVSSEVATAAYTIEATTPTEPDTVNTVAVDMDAVKPTKGGTPVAKVDAATAHGEGTITWTPTTYTSKGKFKGGVTYTAAVVLLPADGKVWADSVTVTVATGKTVTGTKNASGNLEFSVEYDKLPDAAVTGITAALNQGVSYKVDNTPKASDFKVTATYDDGEEEVVANGTNVTISPDTAFTKAGSQTITVTYGGKTANVNVTVAKKDMELVIKTAPTAADINYGQALSVSALTDGKVVEKSKENDADAPAIGGKWEWSDPTETPNAGNAVSKSVKFVPTANDNINYPGTLTGNATINVKQIAAQGNITVDIKGGYAKEDDSLPAPTSGTGVLNESVAGTTTWSSDAAGDTTVTTVTTGGTYYWKFAPTNATNYTGNVTGSVTFEITTKDILTYEFTNKTGSGTFGTDVAASANPVIVKENGITSSTTGLEFTYASSDTNIATVDATGKVTPVKAGKVTITATHKADTVNAGTHVCNTASASYELTIAKAAAASTPGALVKDTDFTVATTSITITAPSTTCQYIVLPSGTAATGSEEGWKDGTSSALTISGLEANTAYKVYVRTKETDTHLASSAVGSDAFTTPAAPSVTSVTVSPSTLSLTVGGNSTLTATVDPSGTAVTWTSNNTDVATVDQSGKVTAVAAGSATITATAGDKSGSCTVTVTSGGGGSHSSGGSGGGGGSTSSTVTVPVSGDDHSVEVSAKVSGSTATIDKIDGLDKVLDSDADTGVVEIDLTALKKDIDTVSISASSIEDIAKAAADSDNDVDGLAVKLDSGTVEFDADALEAIVDQASGSTIDLKLEKANSSDLNSKQKDAVKDMDIHGHFDLTLKGGKVITDFKGGKVSVRIPFTVPSGKEAANFVVIYVADDGTVEEMRTSCSGGYISFTTDHFSKYLIAYKDSEPVEPVETPETADCDGGANCPAGKFTDVNTDLWYHKAIDYVLTNGLMSGVGDGTFAPNANLSRAMLAQILYNQEGRPAASADSVFDDVAAGMWYTNAIAWAAENGVVSGLGDGKFGPNNNITREQLAVMLYRYAGSPAAAGSLSGFADADKASGYAQNALVWATSNGVMSGKGGGMLDPQGQATRAEVAQMLYNYLNK